jgi:hypothetical protein
VRRPRVASKAPLAIAGILSAPVFFVALMAFALKLDRPAHPVVATGALGVDDPTKGTIGKIYLVAFAVALGIVLLGLLASLLRTRLVAVIPAVAGIVVTILLLLPLGTWAAEHTKRYPLGIDNIPPSSATDLSVRGEWEQSARTTADQIGFATIGIASAAILLTAALEVRRRRGIEGPPVPPPPSVVGAPEASPALELELADSDLVRRGRPGRWRWR